MNIFQDLSLYSPLLVGTISIDIDIEEGDFDIICEVHNFPQFAQVLEMLYRKFNQFKIRKSSMQKDLSVIVCNFNYEGFEIEIFGQASPVIKQNGYLHMIIEHRLLSLAGKEARDRIRHLKKLSRLLLNILILTEILTLNLLVLGGLTDAELKKKFSL